MAKVISTKLIDDLDGSVATKTVRVALNGKTVELDLSAANLRRLEKVMAPYLSKGRVVPPTRSVVNGARRTRGMKSPAARDYDIAALRKWASSRRIKVPARGRIPHAIVEQFKTEGSKRK